MCKGPEAGQAGGWCAGAYSGRRAVGKVGEEVRRLDHTGTRETFLSQDRESLPSMEGPDEESEGLLPGESCEWYKPLPPCLNQGKECRGEGGRRVQWPEGWG